MDTEDGGMSVEKFVGDRLREAESILDEIAETTGIVFMCLPGEVAEAVYRFGDKLGKAIMDWNKTAYARCLLAKRSEKRSKSGDGGKTGGGREKRDDRIKAAGVDCEAGNG